MKVDSTNLKAGNMATVRFLFTKPDATGTAVPVDGTITFTPTKRIPLSGAPSMTMMPLGFVVVLGADGAADVNLEPTGPDWAWRIEIAIKGASKFTRYAVVPDVASINFADLTFVDKKTLAPTAQPLPAWVAMAKSTVTSGTVTGDNLILTRTDGTTVNAGVVRGAAGPANTLAAGPVTTGASGTPASVTITGTAPNQTLSLTIPQGIKGDTGNPTVYELRGTGMPNGVVTASPGTYYTDDAGTNGAWRWLKTSGTGNTGWIVNYGDTGWRRIPVSDTDFKPGYGFFQLRRVNAEVSILISDLWPLVSTEILVYPSSGMSGFTPGGRVGAPVFYETEQAGVMGYKSFGVIFKSSVGAWKYGLVMCLTADAWPTTLPGTAA